MSKNISYSLYSVPAINHLPVIFLGYFKSKKLANEAKIKMTATHGIASALKIIKEDSPTFEIGHEIRQGATLDKKFQ